MNSTKILILEDNDQDADLIAREARQTPPATGEGGDEAADRP